MSPLFLVAMFIAHFFATVLDELLFGSTSFGTAGIASRLGLPESLEGIGGGELVIVGFKFFGSVAWNMIAWDYRVFQGELVILQLLLVGASLLAISWGMKDVLIAQVSRLGGILRAVGLPF